MTNRTVLDPQELLEKLEDQPKGAVAEKALRHRLHLLWSGLLRLLIPGYPAATRCASCWARLELLDDCFLEGPEDPPVLHRGVRFWQCPQYSSRTSERYAFINTVYLWEDR
ncbi:MAG: hypothetical protein HY532_00650 [Chloroflexi bacterium]|nr:hypothetical protein [Chloroflexota bacterium]